MLFCQLKKERDVKRKKRDVSRKKEEKDWKWL